MKPSSENNDNFVAGCNEVVKWIDEQVSDD